MAARRRRSSVAVVRSASSPTIESICAASRSPAVPLWSPQRCEARWPLVVLMLELTYASDGQVVPILLAVTAASIVARRLGAPSISSPRLNSDDTEASG
jgi:hypothetical protein